MKTIELQQVKPPCIYYDRCGGCQLQHYSNESQNVLKQEMAERLLGKFGNVEPIRTMDYPYEYRNKIQYAFGYGRKREIIAGMYAGNSHTIIDMHKCLIQDPVGDQIIHTIKKIMKKYKMEPYNEDSGRGFLRHVLIKTGFSTGEVMVVLVVSEHMFPGKKNFVKLLTSAHPEIKTIIMNLNNKNTSMVLGERESTIYGKGYIQDHLCDLRFRISAKSFYQINPRQTEVLYKEALKLADFDGTELIIDAYSGIGTISLITAARVKEVIGVELSGDAVRDAISNARDNSINNVYFHKQDAGEFMVDLAAKGEKIDAVIMDPPRAGSDEPFLSSLVTLNPDKVIYISCNPETQARDLDYLTKHGYQVQRIQPVDMFPQTNHVECIALIQKKTI